MILENFFIQALVEGNHNLGNRADRSPVRLSSISSAGLRVLLIMRKKCEEGVCLSGINETVGEILDQTGFSEILDVEG